MGRRPKKRGRDVHGILLLDKPAGITSNQALQNIKRIFNANRAGHTGSLDKPATGLLPICLGEATKLSAYLLDADKEYETRCQLGTTTTTGDAEGEVISEKAIPELTEQLIESVLERFRGDIQQVPPMFSALKHQGERLYKLAYEGKVVERKSRPVSIYGLSLLEMTDNQLTLRVRCSKGTYIRTLVENIGEALGCGAHVIHLRRTAAGDLDAGKMVNSTEIESSAETGFEALDRLLLPVDSAVLNLPKAELDASSALYLTQGQAVTVPKLPTEGLLRIYDMEKVFLGIGQVQDDGRLAPKRLILSE